MQPGKLIALTTLAIALTAWGVTAHEPQTENGFLTDTRPGVLFDQLELSNEQLEAVQEIFINGQQAFTILFEYHGLEYKDMKSIHHEMVKFRQQNREELAAILDEDQLHLLHQEIFNNGPFAFTLLPEEEKIFHIQELLNLSDDDAYLVTAILERSAEQRNSLLDSAGANPMGMAVLQQDISSYRRELKESLNLVLNDEQLEQIDDFHNQMQLRNHGYEASFRNAEER